MRQEKVLSLGCKPDTERTGLSLPLHHNFLIKAGLPTAGHTPEEMVNVGGYKELSILTGGDLSLCSPGT